MATGEFDRALPRVLVYEGGKVDDPRDPGGRTAYGVTQRTYNAYRRAHALTQQDVYLITPAERSDIYKGMYWDRVDGDMLPAGLDFAVFDAGVNSGTGQAVKWLQASLGSSYTGMIDGQIGDKTLQAVTDHGDVSGLIEEYCSRRLGTLKRLDTWHIYGAGWHARIANVQKIAVEWANATPNAALLVQPVDVTPLQGHRKAPVADNIADPPVSTITTHVTTAAGSIGTVAASSAQQLTPLADTFGWIKYVAGGLTIAGVVAGITLKIINDANDAAKAGTAKASVNPDADANMVPVPMTDATAVPAAPTKGA